MYRIDLETLHQQGGNPNEFTVIAKTGDDHVHIVFSGEKLMQAIIAALENPKF